MNRALTDQRAWTDLLALECPGVTKVERANRYLKQSFVVPLAASLKQRA
ncbi:transposase [Pandoraea sputorum]|uniref:Transposase n=1 Tax=Pandoraea sputorum TaxID=93222 RepID=A0A5E5BIX4_9BURK|nr:transposase [Pandoraea sputorum]